MTSRRTFVIQNVSALGALGALSLIGRNALAQTTVAETDAAAQALGYKIDSTKVDVKKHPNYAPNQSCSGCALFQGKAGDEKGGCAVFSNNLVAAKGWCGAWTKKA